MTYQVIFSDLALKQLKKLDGQIRQRIISTLERIRIRPDKYVKKLVGDEGYRLRVGNYRVILDIDQEKLIILVLRIGHRRSVYDS
ncbi:type II toxin-antitoxin system RelE family toxin [Cuniculiplasma sp. SKW3]|uniref:type II toxin-antitoxin system RelE family toxin n=1 Tax=unclassified Cuniculiplasma TaxID=2619706 RepID=UPI003FD62249